MIAALRAALASVSSELAEKNAVTRVLGAHGHRRQPSVISQRDASGVTRVYLWDDAGIALVSGPSLQGTVYEVHAVPADAQPTSFDLFIPAARGRSAFAAGRKAKALANPAPARTPLAQAPRRIGAAPLTPPPTRLAPVLTRHNAPDAYAVNPALPGGKQTYGELIGNADAVEVGDILFSVTSGEMAVSLVTSKFAIKSFYDFKHKNLGKVLKMGGGRVFSGSAAAPKTALVDANDFTVTNFYGSKTKPTQALALANEYLPHIGIDPAAHRLIMSYGDSEFRLLPDESAKPMAAAPKAPKPEAGKITIAFKPGVGLFVSGDTYAVKEIIKDAGFMWTGKEGKYGYPPLMWAATQSDAATSEASLVGWTGKKDTVANVATKLAQALAAEGASVEVSGIAGASTPKPSAAPAAAKGDPNPPPPSPIESIAVPFGAALEPYSPNPVWADGGGVDAIAARLVYSKPKPGGGLAGAVLRDTKTGEFYLAKYPPNPDMVASEVVAAHLYRAFGAPAPDMRPAMVDGKVAILSPWIDGLKQVASSASGWSAAVPETEQFYLAATFPLDVWLADYDVVGLTYDNMLWVPPDPHVIRVDPGASLMFRASGSLKLPLPGTNAAPDLDSMLFVPKNDKTPVVFAKAKASPFLMLPVADALVLPAVKPFVDVLAGWAGYTMTAGIPVGMTLGGYLAARAQSLRSAVVAKMGVSAPAPAPVASAFTFTAASSSVGMVENIAKKIAALLPSTTASGTSVGPWTVVASPGNGVMVEAKGGVLIALIMAGGEPKTKLEYPIPSGSLTSFVVSRAADIANAFKPYLAVSALKATLSAPSAPTTFATSTAGLTDVSSMTEIDALPDGSIVTGGASPGETFFVRDASGLWRELTEYGDFMPGLFADDVYDTLDMEVLLVNEGSGTGPEADDAIMLSAYYTAAQQVLAGGKKSTAPVAAPAPAPAPAPMPVAAPAPTPTYAQSVTSVDPYPWPASALPYSLAPDPIWGHVGGAGAVAKRLANATKGAQLGSFPGGKMTDPLTGETVYVKFFKNTEHAQTEALASHLYRLLGINAPDVRVVNASLLGSKGSGYALALLSPWKGGYIQRTSGNFDPAERQFLRREFPADVWMVNYDVVGKGPATKYDNLLVTDDFGDQNPKHYLRVDQGAALDYRSTGSVKKSASDWSTNAAQTWGNFLSAGQNPTLFKVFDGATPTNGAEMIKRIGSLVADPGFAATLDYAQRGDLATTLKGRAGWLAGMLSSETPTAAPQPTAAQPTEPTPPFVGQIGTESVLKKGSKQGVYTLLKSVGGTDFYIGGLSGGKFQRFNAAGWVGETGDLPYGTYEILLVGNVVGETPVTELYAKYAVPAAAAPAPVAPTITLDEVHALAAAVLGRVKEKGFMGVSAGMAQFGVAPTLTFFLHEGTTSHAYVTTFALVGGKLKVTLKDGPEFTYVKIKPDTASTVAGAILAFLRLSMANYGLTKAPPMAPPTAPIATGTSLTTTGQLDALPAGSVIVFGERTLSGSAASMLIYQRTPSGWRTVRLGGAVVTSGDDISTVALTEGENWAAIVIRVGESTDLSAFFAALPPALGKSGSGITFMLPVGA
jgi:hypothetical protein